ncbi:MAG: FKBP-type peptidyl-prolyl cis-trans isomerase [bacterium]
MKKINKNQYIAVFVGIAFVAFLLYGNSFMNLFNSNNPQSNPSNLTLPETGVDSTDLTFGDGLDVRAGDTLTVHYVGTLVDGKVFDSSVDRGTPFVFTVGQGSVIRGWDEGLIGMKEGGQRRLVIAPDFGYGAQGVGPIPPNSTLIFEVELLKVERPGSTQ